MSTTDIKRGLVECISTGDWHPKDVMVETCCGNYVHENEIGDGDWVQLHDGIACEIGDTIYCAGDNEYYHMDDYTEYDIAWDYAYEEYNFIDNMYYGWISYNEEGYFNDNTDYCYSECDDIYFMNSEIANDRDYHHSERQDDWVHSDDLNDNDEYTIAKNYYSKTFHKSSGIQYTFGVEMETCDGYVEYNYACDNKLWMDCVHDGSVEGSEYRTGVLQGDLGFEHLKHLCEHLSKCCYVDKTCGVHVHIGGANFNRKFSMYSIMLGLLIQDELYSVMPKSRGTSSYCVKIPENKYKCIIPASKRKYPMIHRKNLQLISDYVYDRNKPFDKHNNKKTVHPNGHYASTRYKWLNLNNCSYRTGPETIEFRLHSGSLDYEKIYNWILVCMCFVRYVENNQRDIIDAYYKRTNFFGIKTIVEAGLNSDMAKSVVEFYRKRYDKFND